MTEAGDTLQAGIERFKAANDQAVEHSASLADEHERNVVEAGGASESSPSASAESEAV